MKLLDTSVLIDLLRGEKEINKEITETGKTFCTCFPIKYELYKGTKLARKTKKGEKEVTKMIEELQNLEANSEAAKKTAELEDNYPNISPFDLMIAAICITHQAEIITKDRDFNKIDELDKTIID